jgi:hypothetical protein
MVLGPAISAEVTDGLLHLAWAKTIIAHHAETTMEDVRHVMVADHGKSE